MTQNKDKSILASLDVSSIIETDFHKVSPNATLGELVDIVAHSSRNIFPVVNDQNQLVGIILLDNIREVMFKHDLYETTYVKELMRSPAAKVTPKESMTSVMKKFDESGAWNLPVLSHNEYVGFVSKSSIFSKYRKVLVKTKI